MDPVSTWRQAHEQGLRNYAAEIVKRQEQEQTPKLAAIVQHNAVANEDEQPMVQLWAALTGVQKPAQSGTVVFSETSRGTIGAERYYPTWDTAIDAAESRAAELEAQGYIVWRSESIGKRWTAHCEGQESTVNFQPRPTVLLEVF